MQDNLFRREGSERYARWDDLLLVQLRGRVRGQSGVSITVALHAVTTCMADPAVQFLVVLGAVQGVQGLAAVLCRLKDGEMVVRLIQVGHLLKV